MRERRDYARRRSPPPRPPRNRHHRRSEKLARRFSGSLTRSEPDWRIRDTYTVRRADRLRKREREDEEEAGRFRDGDDGGGREAHSQEPCRFGDVLPTGEVSMRRSPVLGRHDPIRGNLMALRDVGDSIGYRKEMRLSGEPERPLRLTHSGEFGDSEGFRREEGLRPMGDNAVHLEREPCRRSESERSIACDYGDPICSRRKPYWSGELERSDFCDYRDTVPRKRAPYRRGELERFNDSVGPVMEPYWSAVMEPSARGWLQSRGERMHYEGDGRERDLNVLRMSEFYKPLPYGESRSASMRYELDSEKPVNRVHSTSCERFSNRGGDTSYMPPGLFTNDYFGSLDGQSSRDSHEEEQEKPLHNLRDSCVSKDYFIDSPENIGYHSYLEHMDKTNCRYLEASAGESGALPRAYPYRKIDPYIDMAGVESTSNVVDSVIHKIDGADTAAGCGQRGTREFDHYVSLIEQYPDIKGASGLVVEHIEGAALCKRACHSERMEAHFDIDGRQPGDDNRFGIHARSILLDARREACLNNEARKPIGGYDRMHPDVYGSSGLMVKRDEEALQSRLDHFDGRTGAYMDNDSLKNGKDNHFDLYASVAHVDGRREVYLADETQGSGEGYSFQRHLQANYDGSLCETRDNTPLMFTDRDSYVRDQLEKVVKKGHARYTPNDLHDMSYGDQWRDDDDLRRLTIQKNSVLGCSIDDRSFNSDNHLPSYPSRVSVKDRLGARIKVSNRNVKKRLGTGQKALP